jgi:hypothetical protein
LKSLKSGVQGMSCGAAAGRSSTPTATVRVRARGQNKTSGYRRIHSLAIKTLAVPIHASHDILFKVLILAKMNVQIAAIPVNTALQVPCVETAFKAIEVLIIPEPATRIHAVHVRSDIGRSK